MLAKYDIIGKNYNQTRKADPYLVARLLANLKPEPNKQYLDIGCGTGNYTDVIQRSGNFNFIGIDPSTKMLEKAKTKNDQIDWRIGTAEQTGLDDNSIDGIIGSLTIHHWTDIAAGFSELFRVLKTNGNLLIFTATPQQMKGYWLNHYFPKMLQDSIVQMPDYHLVMENLKTAGFQNSQTEKYFIHKDLQDQFLYCGKEQPELYLDPAIRNGISSFSSLANQEEVSRGLAAIEADIQSKEIEKVIQSYENDFGDYLYINSTK